MTLMKSALLGLLAAASLAGAAAAQTAAPATAAPAAKPAVTQPAPAATATTAPAATAAKPATSQAALLDINTASKDELEKLAGIGTARADAIVKGRPYKGKDELVSKKILPETVYDGVKDKIVARQKS